MRLPLFSQQRTSSAEPAMSEKCHKQSFRLLANGRAVFARQGNNELGKCAGLGFDIDPPTVLLDDDVMGHREAETCTLPGRFGGEEGIEHLLSHLGRYAGTVVVNSDFDCF